jgi:hypothetical protein
MDRDKRTKIMFWRKVERNDQVEPPAQAELPEPSQSVAAEPEPDPYTDAEDFPRD